jgi:hypothetical protein
MDTETLLYDGDCPLCALGARVAGAAGLRTRPFQGAPLPPGVSIEACRGEMQLVDARGGVRSGAQVLPTLLERRGWTRPGAWLLRVPLVFDAVRLLYFVVSRNRRALFPTAKNIRLPRACFGESAGATAAFLVLVAGFAAATVVGYGMSAAPLAGMARGDTAWAVTGSAAAGWALSLPIILGLGWSWVGVTDGLRHAACVMATGALPLIPLAVLNLMLPSAAVNVAALAADGLLMWGTMAWRLKLYGLPVSLTALWFGALAAGGLGAWSLSWWLLA